MEEQTPPAPVDRATQRECYATPESWEMRAEQTPVQTSTFANTAANQLGTAKDSSHRGFDDSYSDFDVDFAMDFACYETPPGAVMYREHLDVSYGNDSLGMSFQEQENPKNTSPCKADCTVDLSMENDGCGNDDVSGSLSENVAIAKCPSPCSQILFSPTEQRTNDVVNGECVTTYCSHDNADTLSNSVDNCRNVVEHDNPGDLKRCEDSREVKVTESCSKSAAEQYNQDTPNISECVLERTIRQTQLTQDQQICDSPVTPNSGENIDSEQDQLVCKSATSTLGSECSKEEQVYDDIKEDMYISIANERTESPTKSEEESEVCIRESRQNISPVQSNAPKHDLNASLMSMGIPQAVIEDELAAFLNMDDPFQCHRDEPLADRVQPIVCHKESSDTDVGTESEKKEQGDTMLADCDQSASQLAPSKRSRKRKVDSQVQRRRSVRIATRESLLSSHVQVCKDEMEAVSKNSQSQSECVPTGKIQLDSIISCSTTTSVADLPSEQLGIDLSPCKRTQRKARRGRRKSVRLQRQNQQLNEETLDQKTVHPVLQEQGTCNNSFLADFADIGLGDDWMPAEVFCANQFAKTPKQKSGRRKSARLSGVSIPLLELHSKSQVHVRVNADDGREEDQCQTQVDHNVAEGISANATSSRDALCDTEPAMMATTFECEDAISESIQQEPSTHADMDLFYSLGDLPFDQVDQAKTSRRKKESGSQRRRSVRLAKKVELDITPEKHLQTTEMDTAPKKQGSAAKSEFTKVQYPLQDNIPGSPNVEENLETKVPDLEDAFTAVKDPPAEFPTRSDIQTPMNVDLPEIHAQPQSKRGKGKRRGKQDTPLNFRKRVSRITDKENDDPDPMAHHPNAENSSVPVSSKEEPHEVESESAKDSVELPLSSSNGAFKVTKKVKDLYLKKGSDVKKHKMVNLETIFESPKRKQSGTPLKVIGGKRIKRFSAFVETPWLGRAGRGRSRKVKKGKEAKRVLSSRKERCWKLDERLSSLEDFSP